MIVVDRFTKMAYFAPTTQKVIVEGAAQLFISNFIALESDPQDHYFREDTPSSPACSEEPPFQMSRGEDLPFAGPITLGIDGQTERTNRTLEQIIRAFFAANNN